MEMSKCRCRAECMATLLFGFAVSVRLARAAGNLARWCNLLANYVVCIYTVNLFEDDPSI